MIHCIDTNLFRNLFVSILNVKGTFIFHMYPLIALKTNVNTFISISIFNLQPILMYFKYHIVVHCMIFNIACS